MGSSLLRISREACLAFLIRYCGEVGGNEDGIGCQGEDAPLCFSEGGPFFLGLLLTF